MLLVWRTVKLHNVLDIHFITVVVVCEGHEPVPGGVKGQAVLQDVGQILNCLTSLASLAEARFVGAPVTAQFFGTKSPR